MAVNPCYGSQMLGFVPIGPSVVSAQLNGTGAAAVWAAFGFMPSASGKTINKVRVFVSAVAGSLGTTDLSCDIYSDSAGNGPSASLGSVTLGSSPSAGTWVEFTGLSVALTAGTQYWIVLKNNNASQGTNNATYRFVANALPNPFTGSPNAASFSGWVALKSVNAGSTFANSGSAASGFRVGYSDGSYEGLPASNAAVGADKAFGTNEVGVKFTSPLAASLRVLGVAFQVELHGAPTGFPKLKLYNGTTLLAATNPITCTVRPAANTWYAGYFASTQFVAPGTVCRVSLADTQTDSSSNYYTASNEVTVDTDANSLPLLPMDGTLEKSVFNGSTWTETLASILPFALILDSSQEFQPQRSSRLVGMGA